MTTPPTTADMPLWLVVLCVAIAVGPLTWMAWAWFREWQDWRAGVPEPAERPPLLTLSRPWRMQDLLIYGAQAAAIAWATVGMANDLGRDRILGFLAINIILVAFATAVLTRVWDLLRGALTRRRSAGRERQ